MIDRISLLLINLALIAYLLMWLAIPADAQPNSVGALATYSTGSATSGNSSAIGACIEATHDVKGYAVLTGRGCYDTGDKAYVGDGSNLRGRLEGHGYFSPKADAIRPFLLVGVNYARQSNSQYSKAITNYYFGGGLNYRNRLILQGEYLLPESGTRNNVSAIRAGGYWLQPITSKWSVKFGGEITSTRFLQPDGSFVGWHRANSITVMGGILRTNNARRINAARPVTIPPPARPRTQYVATQSYLEDFGNYRIINPFSGHRSLRESPR
jgi:hypothetical protein